MPTGPVFVPGAAIFRAVASVSAESILVIGQRSMVLTNDC